LHAHKQEHFHILKQRRRYDHKTGTFTININYETTPPKPTPRTTAVAEAFGLGTDQTQRFTVYDNVQLKIGKTDIVYITGDSGSGKSVLLKALEKDIRQSLHASLININHTHPEPNKPLIETTGKTLTEALELLSKLGLNDAYLFLRTHEQLSDGQKYRHKIAKMAETQAQFWVLDEFAATLDRDTAKIVAHNLQKLARRQGRAVLAATTHTDLFEDLNPSVHIHKRFGREITVNYHPNKPAEECSLNREMRVEEGTLADYKKLSAFHYRSCHCPAPRKIFTLKRGDELCGAIVYSYPPSVCFGRRLVLPRMSQRELNEELSVISRVVVHPKYRTVGLGVKLVRETLVGVGTPFVEAVAVMAKYNPFFEKAGMRKIMESKPNMSVLYAIDQLHELGFNPVMLGSVNQNLQKIRQVEKSEIVKVLEELSRKEGVLRRRLVSSRAVYPSHEEFVERVEGLDERGMANLLKRLAFLAQTKVYLFWENPQNLRGVTKRGEEGC